MSAGSGIVRSHMRCAGARAQRFDDGQGGMVVAAIEVIEKGSGPDVVLVHGDVFGADLTWNTQEPLTSEFRLRMVNRRGFGKSPDTDGEDFEVDAQDVAALLDGGAHLVGHSYGGVVALLAAAQRPDDVKSLVVFE